MKFFAPVVVVVVAFFSVQVDANGVCYDPDHTSGKSASTVQADMQAITSAGFSSVRTYISKFGNTEMGPIITGAGLTAVLGVPYPQSDYQEQMEAAIKAANNGGVYAIMVGNENLAGAGSVPSDMISVINEIKSRVSCKVGTVQRNTEVINYSSISGWSDLVSAVDVLGVNVHPFFNPGTTADGAIDVVDKQWQTMMGNFGDKLLLTETGWPSSGSVSGNTGSLSGEQTFYSAYQQWSSSLSEKFYFQFFDTPGKSTAYEQNFGIYTSDSQSKFTMSQQQSSPSTSPSTSQQQQQQQQQQQSAPTTQAPAPTTAAPTPEPTTATPQPSTATSTPTPTPTPETYQSSGSSETNTTSSEASASRSDNSVQQGSASFTGSNNDVQVSSSSKGSSTEQDSKTDSSTEKTTQTTETAQSTAATNSIGKSSDAQQEQQTSSKDNDNTQEANTQSQSSGSGGVVGLAVGGGACAMLVAFGFIYQARKRGQELEDADDKDYRFSVITPAENICSL